MIAVECVEKRSIQWHYDVSTVFYRLLWGPHIHHGLWQAEESPQLAQIQLTETLAKLAGVTSESDVLDVGCGMGGSSIHLARKFGCRVTGVTLSPIQRWWATGSSWLQGTRSRNRFLAHDA